MKKVVLAALFTLPALYASAQSSSESIALQYSVTFASAQGINTLALASTDKASGVSSNTVNSAEVMEKEASSTKTMSEELNGWVERKLVVVNSMKGSKRYK